jgi:hypothetical protein
MTDPGNAYIEAMTRLAAVEVAYNRECDSIRGGHDARVRAAQRALDLARAEVPKAERGLMDAQHLADQVDYDSEALWYGALSALPARRAARFEPLPEASDEAFEPTWTEGARATTEAKAEQGGVGGRSGVGDGNGGGRGGGGRGGGGRADSEKGPAARVAVLLSDAYDHLAWVRDRRRPMPEDYIGLVLLGAVAAVAGYAGARGLLLFATTHRSPIGVVLTGLGRVIVLVSPFLGLVGVKWHLDRRVIRLSAGPIVATVLAGLITVLIAAMLLPLVRF